MIKPSEGRAVEQVLMSDERHPGAEPPTYQEVRAYMNGELSEEAAASVRERLVAHPDLVRALTAPFPAEGAEPGDPDYVSDEQYPEHWARLQRRMDEPRKVVSFWPSLAAIAATLAVVFGSLFWQAKTNLDAERMPKVALPTPLLLPDGQRGPAEKPPIVKLGGDSVLLVVAIINPTASSFDAYRLDIVDAGAPARSIWRSRLRATAEDDTFTILLPRSFLKPGHYQVLLTGIRGSRQELVSTYSFQVPTAQAE